ncbi:hypothetical protein DOM22_16540 [Bdellovibrio sp. ZAP7]|nr:hypothetical protein DOM22_16540 [Bdellovibrio sp. ZAP7]
MQNSDLCGDMFPIQGGNMSMTFKILISTLLLSFSFSAFAGDELQNGGDIIACPGLEIPTYRSLDLYEGKMVYNLEPALIDQSDYRVIVSKLIDRIEKFDMNRSKLYRVFLKNFASEVQMIPGSEFGNIKDEGFITLPQGCELQQAAAQFRRHTPDGIKYIFNSAIWSNMNPMTRAALVLHEIVYREALMPKTGPATSAKVRYFTAYIHSTKMLNGTRADYAKAKAFAGF